jgi:hypothetical protein
MKLPLIGTPTRPILIDRVVYGTIGLTCVLIVYDGWTKLKRADVVWIIVGPVVAMFISHVFAAGIARNAEIGRPATLREWLSIVRAESLFLLLAVPPLVVLFGLDFAGVSLYDAIRVVIWLEALSLGFWAGLAASKAGLRRSHVALAVVAGLIVGATVLALQVFLQPGKASQGGVV